MLLDILYIANESKDKRQMSSEAKKSPRARVPNMLNPIKGERDRYEYTTFTIGKMLIES